MKQFAAMHEIKSMVDERYHVWLQPISIRDQSTDDNNHNLSILDQGKALAKAPQQEEIIHSINLPKIPYFQLVEATNNWHKDNVLGKGGFGTVYKGEWISTQVASKKIQNQDRGETLSKYHMIQSLNELHHLNQYRHDNILPIYGYAMKDDEILLVCQLMTNGTLERQLKEKKDSFTWPIRCKIAIGTAR